MTQSHGTSVFPPFIGQPGLLGLEAALQGLGPLDPQSGALPQKLQSVLRRGILNLHLVPGLSLRKTTLASHYSVSRAPVGEAIAMLTGEGLIETTPQANPQVSRLSLQELEGEIFLRTAIELAAVEIVATAHSQDQFAQLSRCVRLQELALQDADIRGFSEADDEFHRLILQCTGRPSAAHMAGHFSLNLRRARALMVPDPIRAQQILAEHQEVLEAIRSRNAKRAVAALRHHLAHLAPRLSPLRSQYPSFFQEV